MPTTAAADAPAPALRPRNNPSPPPLAEPLAARAEQKPVLPAAPASPIGGPGAQSRIATVRAAIAADRIDLYLQPIVTLPQQDIRFYEALARLRTDDGTILEPSDIIPWAEPTGLMPMIDYAIVFRCVQVARRLQLKDRRIGLFCNLSGSTLYDRSAFQQLIELLAANSTLASLIVLEITQGTLRTAGARELESLAALATRGFRFSLDHVTDLRLAPRDLADLGVRFVKVSAARLLDRTRADEGIPSTELSDALGLVDIELIAERIEEEATVTELIDCDVRYGQGFLFSPPRQVLTEALQRAADRVERAAGPERDSDAPGRGPVGAVADSDPAEPAAAPDYRDGKSPRLRPRI
jgi:cyclic-di-GMP phosphodiesterase TipF (flagellum assembly factor)